MKSENYWIAHFFEALNDTLGDFAKPSKNIIIFIIGIIIIGFALGFTFGEIFTRIIFPIGGLMLLFSYIFCNKWMNISKRYYQENILLKEQQSPKLLIEFDENDPPYIDDDIIQIKGNKFCLNERLYRISIKNISNSKTIEDVSVKLTNIDECPSGYAGKLPVNLKFMHDSKPYKYSVDVHPEDRVFVDVVIGVMDREKQKMYMYGVCSIKDKSSFRLPINEKGHRITIEAKGKDTICEPKYFMIGLKNKKMIMWPTD